MITRKTGKDHSKSHRCVRPKTAESRWYEVCVMKPTSVEDARDRGDIVKTTAQLFECGEGIRM